MQWYKVFDSVETARSKIKPNSLQLVILGGRKICLSRTTDGFRAIEDACPHRGEPLHKGSVNYLGEVVCPLHSYRYRLLDGVECEGRTQDAEVFEVKINQEGFFIGVP